MARDLDDYALRYRELPFEPVQLAQRRRVVLDRVAVHAPGRLLEVGCGEAPLFLDLPGIPCVVVEPTPAFAARARRAAAGRDDVVVVEALVEDTTPTEVGGPFDVVVVSCLLHEVPDPQRLLGAVATMLAPAGVLHVNVPHAHSLHRLLAQAMGLIPDVWALSETQRTMQQRGIYDAAGLRDELGRAGFVVRTAGGILVKPFTHRQMQDLLDTGFLTPALLGGLAALGRSTPELASEIWMDAVLAR